ncbi:MAG: L-rhamnose/proton symporter RhaT [Verrucomicrobiales bacterium]
MSPLPFLGIVLHAIGGFAAGSFYIPYKRVRDWSWESYWLVGGVFSWLVAPLLMAAFTVPDLPGVLARSPADSLLLTYMFGLLWGVGGLTFGLSMRYLGISLGYALALGFCAAFGTLMPPVFHGELPALLGSSSGRVTLIGVLVCLVGIAICARAGMRKEKELSAAEKRGVIAEFNFVKGVWVAIFAGIMSACMAFGFAAGKPIAAASVDAGSAEIFQNNAVLVVILAGGLTTNAIWCVYLNVVNGSWRDYFRPVPNTPAVANWFFAALAGFTWYLQFFFYGMGTTKMGKYDFSSWTLHMAFIIIFSNIWALVFKEWKGAGPGTLRLVYAGLAVLLLSTLVIGLGNFLIS